MAKLKRRHHLACACAETDAAAQKKGCEGGTVRTLGLGDVEMVFALLAEVVTFRVQHPVILVWEPSFQGAHKGAFDT